MTLQLLQSDLDAARTGMLSMPVFGQRLRDTQLPAALPAAFADVLGQLADRIDASALFSGDSCSFSSTDLLDAVQSVLDKAANRLG